MNKEVKELILDMAKSLVAFTKASLRTELELNGHWKKYSAQTWLLGVSQLVASGKLKETLEERSMNNTYYLADSIEETLVTPIVQEKGGSPNLVDFMSGLTRYDPTYNRSRPSHLRFDAKGVRGVITADSLKEHCIPPDSNYTIYYDSGNIVLSFGTSGTHKLDRGRNPTAGSGSYFGFRPTFLQVKYLRPMYP